MGLIKAGGSGPFLQPRELCGAAKWYPGPQRGFTCISSVSHTVLGKECQLCFTDDGLGAQRASAWAKITENEQLRQAWVLALAAESTGPSPTGSAAGGEGRGSPPCRYWCLFIG